MFFISYKRSQYNSVLRGKCPYFHSGILLFATPYNLNVIWGIHESCQLCKRTFNLEAGLYFSAMYVSYIIGVSLLTVVWIGLAIVNFKIDIGFKIIGISALWVSLVPLID